MEEVEVEEVEGVLTPELCVWCVRRRASARDLHSSALGEACFHSESKRGEGGFILLLHSVPGDGGRRRAPSPPSSLFCSFLGCSCSLLLRLSHTRWRGEGGRVVEKREGGRVVEKREGGRGACEGEDGGQGEEGRRDVRTNEWEGVEQLQMEKEWRRQRKKRKRRRKRETL